MSQQMDKKTEISEQSSMIGGVLKQFRKSLGLSVPQVAAIMEKSYNIKVAAKTIYGWESNQCYPPTPKMLALCEIYQINNITTPFQNIDDSQKMMIAPNEQIILRHLRERPSMLTSIYLLLEITQEELDEALNSKLADQRRLRDVLSKEESSSD